MVMGRGVNGAQKWMGSLLYSHRNLDVRTGRVTTCLANCSVISVRGVLFSQIIENIIEFIYVCLAPHSL
jgi:hypothetical protein